MTSTLSARDRVRDLVYRYGLLVLLVVLVVFFAATQPSFGTWRNVLIILQSVAITAIVALGVTVSLSVNGFDLSIGSTISFVVMLTAAAQVYWSLGPWVAVLLGLLAGLGIGLVNGFLVVVARVPDLLATLATMFVFAGLALVLTSGQSVSTGSTIDGQPAPGSISPEFLWLGRGTVLGIPITVVVMVVLGVAVTLLLSRTRTGRLFGAIGGNPEAARLAGVHVGRNKVLAYAISGVLASVGGILLTARLGRGDVGVGGGYLLETVAAALIGFAVLGANKANGFGTVVGAIFVGVVLNGLTMMNLPYYTQDLIKGLLLLGALVLSFSGLFKRKDS
ncbi:ABC transporter permease [Salinibacterium soli]|uniref:ABC transporter permease n=1 Tax=Antiquaquibacter soli TaxID=3064523 RepID=A0ABT9BWG5_9MICO|nr:ABC transporter permease [Protaetiibacter sp. WY-16]MDO7883647.1 ABC transporter permease [Protaetiibacter sp. WY-16]